MAGNRCFGFEHFAKWYHSVKKSITDQLQQLKKFRISTDRLIVADDMFIPFYLEIETTKPW